MVVTNCWNPIHQIGERCGGWLETEKETELKNHLRWARICIKGPHEKIPATIDIGDGDLIFSLPIWPELPLTHRKMERGKGALWKRVNVVLFEAKYNLLCQQGMMAIDLPWKWKLVLNVLISTMTFMLEKVRGQLRHPHVTVRNGGPPLFEKHPLGPLDKEGVFGFNDGPTIGPKKLFPQEPFVPLNF
ncbi:hypothetical protein FXO38_20666 [Capsicum annuum]|nr:hypothetical protein FXO37_29515 [Capsicum annuum]KAF3643344.1 hypothetical protein FXO38_20666 [Capsicum annuum]